MFRPVAAALVPVVLALAAWGQMPPATGTVEEQFAAYHRALDGAANDLRPASPEHLGSDDAPSSPSQPPPAVPQDSLSAALVRVRQLRSIIEPILRKEGVPPEMAAVVLVESGGRLAALSPKGARGLWQLMPETARRYGLAVSPATDERLDPVKATRAAAQYLRDLRMQFGDWKLAFAAYNAGEGAVERAISRAGGTDLRRVLALLPAETRAYVPAVANAVPLFGNSRTVEDPAWHAARAAFVVYAQFSVPTW